MDNQRKDHIDPKGLKQRSRPKQLQTHNLPTNNVENIYSTNKRREKIQGGSLKNRKVATKNPEAQQSYFIKIYTS